MTYSEKLADYVKRFFDEDNWRYQFDEEDGIFSGGITIGGMLKSVKFFINVKSVNVVNCTILNISTIEKNRPAVAEFIARANYGMSLGCFEMDFRDGEVRFRLSASQADFEDDYTETMKLLMLFPCQVLQKYGEGLLGVMFGLKNPAKAIEEIEG